MAEGIEFIIAGANSMPIQRFFCVANSVPNSSGCVPELFSAIGAACSEIRDAQSLMTPVMLLVIIPMMCTGPILDSPTSVFSRAISLFPPATPMLMFVRIAIPPGPATWEIVLGTLLTVLFAIDSSILENQ